MTTIKNAIIHLRLLVFLVILIYSSTPLSAGENKYVDVLIVPNSYVYKLREKVFIQADKWNFDYYVFANALKIVGEDKDGNEYWFIKVKSTDETYIMRKKDLVFLEE